MSHPASTPISDLVPRNLWYPVLASHALRGRPVGLERFGQRLVLWRTADGRAVAMADRCPHRGMALSAGRVVEGELECAWHGFRFGAGGACTRIPANGRDARIPAGMAADGWSVREGHGLVWLWWGEARETLPPLPWIDEVPGDLRGTSDIAFELPYAWDRMMEANLDIHHVSFLHRRSLPGAGTLLDPFRVESDGETVTAVGAVRKDDGRSADESPGLAFRVIARLPGLLLLEFGKGLQLVVACTPIDEERTWVYGRYHQSYTRLPLLRSLIPWLAIQYERFFVQPEDWRGFAALRERRFDREAFRLIPADAPIIEFFRLVERHGAGRPVPRVVSAEARH